MSVVGSNILAGASGAGAAGYEIERSLRFNSADSAYLNRTPSSAGNRRTFTLSFWIKRAGPSSNTGHAILYAGTAGATQNRTALIIGNAAFSGSGNSILFGQDTSGSWVTYRETNALFRDHSAWAHIVLAVDSTQATGSDRIKIYVNGVLQTSFATSSDPSQNHEFFINNNNAHHLGDDVGNYVGNLDAYLAEIHHVDGQQLAATDFGEFDDNNVWQPKEYSGTYGTNGFKLDFSDNTSTTTIAEDSSGNNNDFTANNFSVASGSGNDSLIDSPTNYTASGNNGGNYATLNPLDSSSNYTFSNGNLNYTHSTSGHQMTSSTIAVNSGKWYVEVTPTALGGSWMQIGISPVNTSNTTYTGNNGYAYIHSGSTYGLASSSSYGNSYAANDVIGIAFDADGGNLYFYKNGVVQNSGTAAFTSIDTSKHWRFSVSHYNSGTGFVNFGQRSFAYTPPTGYLSLCTTNLPDPTIADGSTAFDAITYTGNGSTQTITGLGFSPDFVWIKNRAQADNHKLLDTVRGATEELESNTTDAEVTNTDGLTAFNSDGFDLGADAEYNTNTETYVSWTWDAGTSTVSNTDGTITSSVRANTSAGFSIVSYTGTGANATFGHGLNAAPEWILIKRRDAAQNWDAFHQSISGMSGGYLHFNSTTAFTSSYTGIWNSTDPTSSVISIGTDNEVNASSGTYIALCWTPVDQYSAFGSYEGNASTDGPFVYTGMRPAYVLIRSTGSGNTYVYDTAREESNITTKRLYPNLSNAEDTGAANFIDIVSNGFKLRHNNAGINASGVQFVFAAFSEHPFKTARAR